MKLGEILITFTDKDGRVVVCPPATYIEAAQVLISKDEEVSWEQLKPTENLMNRTVKCIVKMFNIGEEGSRSQQDKINKAVVTKDTPAPNVSFLWKDGRYCI